jgi:hypothetical protein
VGRLLSELSVVLFLELPKNNSQMLEKMDEEDAGPLGMVKRDSGTDDIF